MYNDPIVEEIHRIREEIAKRFNYDLNAICEDMRERQAQREKTSAMPTPQREDASPRPTEAA